MSLAIFLRATANCFNAPGVSTKASGAASDPTSTGAADYRVRPVSEAPAAGATEEWMMRVRDTAEALTETTTAVGATAAGAAGQSQQQFVDSLLVLVCKIL